MATTLAIIGATGLVGNNFLTLSKTATIPGISKVIALTRRPIAGASLSDTVTNLVTSDLAADMPPDTKILFSGLGTTRAAAGGFENQYKIEHGINVEAAVAAKKAGASVYVLVSAAGADCKSRFAYSAMKGDIERDTIGLEFDRTIVLRPGLIIGDRAESRPMEHVAQVLFRGIIKISYFGNIVRTAMVAPAVDIAKAAMRALQTEGSGVQILENSDIVRLAAEYDSLSRKGNTLT
ncbi:protein fmp52-1, mitochondrial [Lipomyces arxii]|uniref:protein fmp52-1, mitochondrial n=1 Tax=Lipomyces arxii TaxID=56418 RepID=UPI0034CF4B50